VTHYGVGSNENGAVYEYEPAKGTERTLYNFQGPHNGKLPFGRLVYGNGMLYGTTRTGGASNDGTVFSIDPKTRAETVVYSATVQIGVYPTALVYQGGMLYGVAEEGGPFGGDGFGTVFKVDPGNGTATLLYAFTDGADGEGPNSLIYRDGSLYVTVSGEVTGNGTVVSSGIVDSVNPQTGALTVLYSFPASGVDGSPAGALPNSLSAHGGAFYGTTFFGGSNGCAGGCGTLFKLNVATGAEKLLHKFTGKADGAYPVGFAYEGDAFYGTTSQGGDLSACNNSGCGTVFKFTP
jgi:uncharacterized repeat protein (TIGR03803 family)